MPTTDDRRISVNFWNRIRVPIFTALMVAAISGVSIAAGRFDIAVYALSFWQYGVYALAFSLRRIDHATFKRDAVLLKALSMALLGVVLIQTVPSLASLVVAAAGFSLNMWAAAVIGTDRTYYGVEIKGMPVEWSRAMPFSIFRHPMLLGNMIGYGGLLLDPELRQSWWPLVLLHVAGNFLILLMESRDRIDRSRALYAIWGGLLAGTLLFTACFSKAMPNALLGAAIIAFFGAALIEAYAKPSHDLSR